MQVCRRPDSIASWAWHAALPSAVALHVWLTLNNTLQALPAALRVSAALRLAAAALAAACWARPPDPGYPGPHPSAPPCGLVPTLGLPPLPAMLLWQAALVAAAVAWLRLRPSLWARLVRRADGLVCWNTAMLVWQAVLVAAAVLWLRLRPSVWARLVRPWAPCVMALRAVLWSAYITMLCVVLTVTCGASWLH